MRRLAFVVNNADFLVSHRLVLLKGALRAGYRVLAIVPEGPSSTRLRELGCEVHHWALRRTGQRPDQEARALGELVLAYRRWKPSLVHHVTIKPMLYGSIAARLTGVPAAVNAVSGLGYVFLSSGWAARVRREGLKAAYRHALTLPNSRVVLQNDDDEQQLRELGVLDGARIVKIRGSGVDLQVFKPSPIPEDAAPLVVMPARLLRDKGVREFAEAARLVQQAGVRARFALVGGEDEGNPAGVPRAEVNQWVAGGILEWWGHQSDMARVFAQATVVCLPSYREGMPKALLEAAAVGRAIVTTDVPGCRDAVAGGKIGVLVPPRDPHQLADAVGRLLTHRHEAVTWGQAAAAWAAEHFSDLAVLDAHLAMYDELLRARGH